MPDFKKLLTEVAKPAVNEIVAIQQDFLAGKGEIKYKENDGGVLKSPATIGDERSQAIYTELLSKALGADNIYYKNEEEVGDAEARANEARKSTAKYRIAIDPIDGTGNYSGQKADEAKGIAERKPVNRSLDELTPDEWASKGVRPGWGSMVAIQERQADGEWKTVASSIYESNSADKPGDLKGKFYVAEAGKQGVSVIDLQTGQETGVIFAQAQQYPKRIIEGGFPKVPGAAEAQKAIQGLAKEQGDHLINLSCVAQSALGVLTGKAEGFFQGHPNLHDALAMLHIGETAGLHVAALDTVDGKPAVSISKDGKTDVQYPVFMASTPELAIGMVQKYIEGAGIDPSKVTVRDGNWESKSFEKMRTDMLARAGKDVSGSAEIAHQPTTERKLA